jgi:uncharacterized membrane protein YfhO
MLSTFFALKAFSFRKKVAKMRFVLFFIFGFMLCEMEAKMKGRGNQASKFLRAFLARNNAVVDSKGRIRPVDKYSFRMP